MQIKFKKIVENILKRELKKKTKKTTQQMLPFSRNIYLRVRKNIVVSLKTKQLQMFQSFFFFALKYSQRKMLLLMTATI